MKRLSLLMVLILTGCSWGTPSTPTYDTTDGLPSSETEVNSPVPTEATHTVETWFAISPLFGVDGNAANGIAQGYLYSNGHYKLVLKLNAPVEEEGKVYTAWLLKPETSERISLGEFTMPLNDARHEMSFETERDLTDFLEIEVSLETKSASYDAPTNKIAKGSLAPKDR